MEVNLHLIGNVLYNFVLELCYLFIECLRYYSKYWEYLFSFVSVNIVINYLLGF